MTEFVTAYHAVPLGTNFIFALISVELENVAQLNRAMVNKTYRAFWSVAGDRPNRLRHQAKAATSTRMLNPGLSPCW